MLLTRTNHCLINGNYFEMKKMIFHIPMKIDRNRFSASQIRPLKMISAFKEMGYEVDIVEGYGKERKLQIRKIKENILKGIVYDFLYSESSTMPTLLTESRHLPTYPFLDFSFFSFCKKHEIKIGLFYRDIFWRFATFDYGWKTKISKYFYKYDLIKYNQLVDVLFLPSLKMLSYIPFSFHGKVCELPAGVDIFPIVEQTSFSQTIEVLYIGGIGGAYDLKLFMRVIASLTGIHLTVCCRREDWTEVECDYKTYLNSNISIVHLSGNDLMLLYQKADLCSTFFKLSEYLTFAIPYKFFEAIGYGCPVIAVRGSGWSDFIEQNHTGVVCDYGEEALRNVLSDPELKMKLINWRKNTEKVRLKNSWFERCKTVRDQLL